MLQEESPQFLLLPKFGAIHHSDWLTFELFWVLHDGDSCVLSPFLGHVTLCPVATDCHWVCWIGFCKRNHCSTYSSPSLGPYNTQIDWLLSCFWSCMMVIPVCLDHFRVMFHYVQLQQTASGYVELDSAIGITTAPTLPQVWSLLHPDWLTFELFLVLHDGDSCVLSPLLRHVPLCPVATDCHWVCWIGFCRRNHCST